MMPSAHCRQKAEMCERRAAACGEAEMRDHWLEMAGEWRGLSDDESAQATTARLLLEAR